MLLAACPWLSSNSICFFSAAGPRMIYANDTTPWQTCVSVDVCIGQVLNKTDCAELLSVSGVSVTAFVVAALLALFFKVPLFILAVLGLASVGYRSTRYLYLSILAFWRRRKRIRNLNKCLLSIVRQYAKIFLVVTIIVSGVAIVCTLLENRAQPLEEPKAAYIPSASQGIGNISHVDLRKFIHGESHSSRPFAENPRNGRPYGPRLLSILERRMVIVAPRRTRRAWRDASGSYYPRYPPSPGSPSLRVHSFCCFSGCWLSEGHPDRCTRQYLRVSFLVNRIGKRFSPTTMRSTGLGRLLKNLSASRTVVRLQQLYFPGRFYLR